jgi:hypothetical protein
MTGLDELLSASAPSTAVPGNVSDHALRILRETGRVRSRRWGWIMAGTLGLVLVTGGTAAAVSGGLLGSLPWMPDITAHPGDAGQPCDNAWHIAAPAGVSDSAPYLLDARRVLSGIDVADLDISNALAAVTQEYEVIGVYDDAGERVRLTAAEYKAEALSITVREEMERQVTAHGFGAELVSFGYHLEGATLCAGEIQ